MSGWAPARKACWRQSRARATGRLTSNVIGQMWGMLWGFQTLECDHRAHEINLVGCNPHLIIAIAEKVSECVTFVRVSFVL